MAHTNNQNLPPALYQQLFASAAESMVITDVEGLILEVNQAFCALSGYSAEEVRGRDMSLMRSDRHNPAFYADMWQRLRTEGSWQGNIWPELAKEFDISWSQRYAWHCLVGELPLNGELTEFWTRWQDNFVAYCAMEVFTLTVSPDC